MHRSDLALRLGLLGDPRRPHPRLHCAHHLDEHREDLWSVLLATSMRRSQIAPSSSPSSAMSMRTSLSTTPSCHSNNLFRLFSKRDHSWSSTSRAFPPPLTTTLLAPPPTTLPATTPTVVIAASTTTVMVLADRVATEATPLAAGMAPMAVTNHRYP